MEPTLAFVMPSRCRLRTGLTTRRSRTSKWLVERFIKIDVKKRKLTRAAVIATYTDDRKEFLENELELRSEAASEPTLP